MRVYVLRRIQKLPISIQTAWEFFSDPRNLAVITPPWLGFKITSDLLPHMYAGMIISYTVTPFFGIPVPWMTEITRVDEPYHFIDEQRAGPYRFWQHQHHFREITGGIEAEDIVHYAMPFGPVGRIVHALIVRNQLSRIFAYRREALIKKFGAWTVAE